MLFLRSGLLLSTAAAASLQPRQDGCTNQTDIDTEIGLKFDSYCGVNVAANDIRNHDSPTLEDCLNACANSAASAGKPPCRAVAYNTNQKRCWEKDGNTTLEDASSTDNTIMAFAHDDAWVNAKHDCPYTNGSIETDSNGYQYQILCGVRYTGNNFDPDVRPDYQPFHAATMMDCLNFCSDNSPLCYGVLYSEGLDIGYRNCWPKNANGTTSSGVLVPDGAATSALGLLPVNSTCAGSTYTAASGAQFNTSCDMGGSGPNIKRVHTSNFDECMDECANYTPESGNSECRNIMYQPNSENGYLNCYLKYALDNVTSQAQWHMASLDGSTSPSNDDDDDSNTGLIVGAVVGPVAGIALIGGAVFWYLRRRRRTAAAGTSGAMQDKAEMQPFKSAPGTPYQGSDGSPYVSQSSGKHDYVAAPPSSVSGPSPAVEMDTGARAAQELPGANAPRYEMQG